MRSYMTVQGLRNLHRSEDGRHIREVTVLSGEWVRTLIEVVESLLNVQLQMVENVERNLWEISLKL